MSEWLKEHAWKAIPASCMEQYQNISSRSRFNGFPPLSACRYEPVNVGVSWRFRGDLTQFLHSFERHLFAYVAVFVGTGGNELASWISVAILPVQTDAFVRWLRPKAGRGALRRLVREPIARANCLRGHTTNIA
jgi:hypothetical protein